MNISIIGAAGGVGRELTISLIEEAVMDKTECLQLIGRKGSKSDQKLYGLKMDLFDSFAEIMPEVDIANTPEEVRGDIIIMVAGEPLHMNPDYNILDRGKLAKKNIELFYTFAESIAKNSPDAIVIIISNPVELGVHVFSKFLSRFQVIGMGAFIDTLRFRREIAEEFNVRRQRVQGFVLGEHGIGFTPIWSSVKVYGVDRESCQNKLEGFYEQAHKHDPSTHWQKLAQCIKNGRIDNVCSMLPRLSPDERAFLSPFISNYTGTHALAGASGAAMRLIRSIKSSNETLSACQFKVEGEFLDIHGVFGVPVIICNKGILCVEPMDDLWENEKVILKKCSENINKKLELWDKGRKN